MSFQSITDFLISFLSNDNSIRKQAEGFLDQLSTQNPVQALEFLRSGLELTQTEHAELSALLLKKRFLDNPSTTKLLPKETLFQTISFTKSLITPSKRLLLLKRLVEIIVQIYTFLDNYNEMINIMLFIDSLSENTPNFKKLTMYFIEILCDYSFDEELLTQFSQSLTALFEKYLLDKDLQVRVCAIKSMTIFLAYITDEKFVKKFTSIFPILLSTSIEAIKFDEESGKISLESLNDLIETHPKFIKPIINDLISLSTEIFTTKSLSEAIRNSALNLVLSLCLNNQSLIRKCEIFQKRTIIGLLQVMVENDDNSIEEWNKDLEENCISLTNPANTAQEILGKIAPELGVKFLFPLFMPFIKEILGSGVWQQQYAGLMAIGLLAEGSKEHFSSELEGLMNLLSPLREQSNPRVIYALLTAFALFSTEFSPELQRKYHGVILPYVIAQMKNQNYMKIQIRAVSSLVNFSRELIDHEEESKILLLYSDEIMSCLMSLFEKSLTEICYPLQEEILNVLSMISVVIGDNFSNYYNVFMPGLKQLLMTLPNSTPKQVSIRTLTIECIGFLVSSIKGNSAIFIEDLNLIMKFLMDLQQGNQLTQDDPHHQAIISVYSQFSSCLKENFATFLPVIYPHVLKALDINVDFHLQDETQINEKTDKKMAQAVFDLKLLGGKKVLSVNTDALEVKINAANAIFAISKNVKKAFLPFVDSTKEVISKYLDYKYSKEIRKSCMKTVNNLIVACSDEDQMANLFDYFLPIMMKESLNLLKAENYEDMLVLLKQVNKSLKFFKSPLIAITTVNELLSLCTASLKMQESLKQKTMNEFEDVLEDCDDDQKDDFKGEYESYNDIMQIVMEISCNLIKAFRNGVENMIFTNIVPYYYRVFSLATATDNELLYAICLFDEVLEYCSEEFYVKAIGDILTNFLNIFNKTMNLDMIQSLVYGLGVFAKRTSAELFKPYYLAVCQAISVVIENKDAFTSERVVCTECAIGALGKLALHQNTEDLKLRTEILRKFLGLLPLKNEPEEAQNVHKMLLNEILSKNEFLLKVIEGEALKKMVVDIQAVMMNNPELEILDDEGKKLMLTIMG